MEWRREEKTEVEEVMDKWWEKMEVVMGDDEGNKGVEGGTG